MAPAPARPSRAALVPLVIAGVLCALSSALSGLSGFVHGFPNQRGTAASKGTAGSSSAVARSATQTLERPRASSSEWRLKIGHAIDVLRTDLQLFTDDRHAPDLSIFSKDIVVEDARLPSFRLSGLAAYKSVISTLKWSLQATCDHSRMEITAMQPPIHRELYMRWRLQLWPRDVLASAKDFLAPAFGPGIASSASFTGEPLVVEGYSRYEFDAWSAEIVRHTIDITNPPMLIVDLLRSRQTVGTFTWAPVGTGVGLPNVMFVTNEAWGNVATVHTPFDSTSWSPSLPQSCEDDYECNDGRANFPLQCCEVPLLGRFCCKPEDFQPSPQQPNYVPLPVPTDEFRRRSGGD
mmetsp:Transcript_13969/g.32817  ORF Transcript_13969/g.32817 Transcript_13969/m.32817 type:complete len:350 (-) Transcript_13969:56-1105(-)